MLSTNDIRGWPGWSTRRGQGLLGFLTRLYFSDSNHAATGQKICRAPRTPACNHPPRSSVGVAAKLASATRPATAPSAIVGVGIRVTMSQLDPFSLYARVWGLSNLCLHATFYGGSVLALMEAGLLQVVFTVLAAGVVFLPSNGQLLLIAHAVSIAQLAQMLPTVFDADWWAAHHDGAFVLAAAAMMLKDRSLSSRAWTAADRAAVFDILAQCLRTQASIWYAGAFFWKLNAAFFDPSNCPALFFLQLLDYWVCHRRSNPRTRHAPCGRRTRHALCGRSSAHPSSLRPPCADRCPSLSPTPPFNSSPGPRLT